MSLSYNKTARLLHWLMAFLILSNLILAIFMDDAQKPLRSTLFGVHISFGVMILTLIILRIIWTFTHKSPAMPETISPIENKIAKGVQHLLYLLMFIVPMMGYLMINSKGFPVSFFHLFSMPVLMSKNPELHELFENFHVILGWTLGAFVLIHIAAAIKHKRANNGVFERMWPKK